MAVSACLTILAFDVDRGSVLLTFEHRIDDLEPHGTRKLSQREHQNAPAARVPAVSVSSHGRYGSPHP